MFSFMARDLKDELKQTKDFPSPEVEAYLSIVRTAAVLEHELAEALKPAGITPTQYNVLRILRGAGPEGLCRNEVGARLVRQVPDVTRLLDRLEDAGQIARERSDDDRRYVTTRITRDGLRTLERLDDVVIGVHKRQLGHVGTKQLRTLIGALGVARERGR
jgi:DNA-binding MarR family transcriptional regulator